MTDCLFCKIAAGTIPAERVYEDERTIGFLDIRPVRPGHVLVIPKAHADAFRALPPADRDALFGAGQAVATKAMAATGASAFNLQMNDGEDSGQVVMHAHLHVIPRHPGDGLKLWPGTPYADGEAAKMGEKIRGA